MRFLLFIILLLNCFAGYAASGIFEQKLQDQIKQFEEKQSLPGIAVQLYKNGELFEYFSGYADIASKKPVNAKTIFKIGDLSELITALLFARQVDMGRLQLDHKVSQYLNKTSNAFQPISLKELATHTSGLPAITERDFENTKGLNDFLQTWKNERTDSQYNVSSALNMEILARVVKARKKNWLSRLYVDSVLKPLGMQPIGIRLPASFKKQMATGYVDDNKPIASSKESIFLASKGMLASVNDMQRFLAANIGLPGTPENLLYPIRMTQVSYVKLQTHQKGLAWNIYSLDKANLEDLSQFEDDTEEVTELPEIPLYHGDYLFEKAGGRDGFSAYIALIPDSRTGIVVLTNKSIKPEIMKQFSRHILLQQSGHKLAGDFNGD